jgi:probable phosphoglycerate mutase
MTLNIFTDGGSRGNPGHSACACVFLNHENQEIATFAQYLGIQTNNEAEYQGVILALDQVRTVSPTATTLHFYLDSQLVVEQLSGRWRIKHHPLAALASLCYQKIAAFEPVTTAIFTHIPREQNARADDLVNQKLAAVILR